MKANTSAPTAWTEWMDRCAFEKTSPESKEYLSGFIMKSMSAKWAKLGHSEERHSWVEYVVGSSENIANDSWAVLENSILRSGKTITNLPAKSYLAKKTSDSGTSHLEALMNGMIRDFLAKMHRYESTERPGGQQAESLDKETDSESNDTLSDLIGPTSQFAINDIERREFEEIAEELGPECLKLIDEKFWPLLASNALGWKANDPRLDTMSTASQSTRYEWIGRIEKIIRKYVEFRFKGEPDEAMEVLAFFLYIQLATLALKELQQAGKFQELPES